MDSASLYTAYEYAARSDFVTEGIAVIRRGYVVGEEYFRGYGPTTRFASYSVAKSFLSAVVGVAIDRGYVAGVDQLAYPYFDAWQAPGTDERKRAITVRHLLTMSSGLRFTDATTGGLGADIEGILSATDSVAYVLGLPSVAEPGTRWNYSGGDSLLLSGIVQATTGRSVFEFGREHVFDRIGIGSMTWSSDPAGHTFGGWGIGATVRDYARFGYLYQKGGWWDGQALVSEGWVRQSLTAARPSVPWYGFQWWLAPHFSDRPAVPDPRGRLRRPGALPPEDPGDPLAGPRRGARGYRPGHVHLERHGVPRAHPGQRPGLTSGTAAGSGAVRCSARASNRGPY